MGDASAVPENLYKYSDRCTHDAENAQHAVHHLTPAISEYLRGAATQQSGVNVDVSAVVSWINGGRYANGSIDRELEKQLAATHDTDRRVRTVGLAFQLAGGKGALDKPLATPVKATDDAIGKEVAEYQLGAKAAAQLPYQLSGEAADSDELPLEYANQPVFALLAAHADDPEFCRGLLQAGGPEALQKLLGSIADDQFRFNLKTGGPASDVVIKIIKNAFADPTLAAQLAPSLPKVMAETLENVPENWRLPQAWKELLPVYTELVKSVHDPATVRKIVTSLPLSKEMTADELKQIREPLHDFLVTCAAYMLTPPPDTNDGKAIANWAQTTGGNLSWLLRYSSWMAGIDKEAEEAAEHGAGALTTFGLEVVAGIVLTFAPEIGVPGEIVLHSLAGVAVYKFEPDISQMLVGGGAEKLDGALGELVRKDAEDWKKFHNGEEMTGDQMFAELLRRQSMALATIQMFNSGRVVSRDTGKPVTLKEALGSDDITTLAKKLDSPDWSENFAIKSRNGQNLKLVLDGVEDPFLKAEKYGPRS